MKPFAIAFCLFYVACCIHDTFGQQEKKTVQAIPTQETKGETKPVAPKETAPAKPAGPEAKPPRIYVIQSGDNPWTIAQKHGIEVDALMKANDIKDPKNLKIGDQLTLPEGVESKNAPAPAKKPAVAKKEKAAPKPQSGDDWEMYTIRKGDNPWKISRALQVDHQKIIQLNEGLDFTRLNIGQQIKIPKKK